ncbi:MAG: helix-hairpin-helix domain-containing protein [Deltaproteobacteria bacterium]|nr:helix-hairpin-helix domain-containing protein [Deltaproteobacteria bacterium]
MEREKRFGAYIALSLIMAAFFLLRGASVSGTQAPPFIQRPSPAQPAAAFPGFPIDINMATADDLRLLPGIGEKTAMRILDKRAELGGFRSIEDLTGVERIGRVKLDRIRKYIKVGAPASAKG